MIVIFILSNSKIFLWIGNCNIIFLGFLPFTLFREGELYTDVQRVDFKGK